MRPCILVSGYQRFGETNYFIFTPILKMEPAGFFATLITNSTTQIIMTPEDHSMKTVKKRGVEMDAACSTYAREEQIL
jgi:hypothetical protein